MIKNLQNIIGVNVDATKKMKTDAKRGTWVAVDETTGELVVAADLSKAQGFVVRDVVVTRDVANGIPVSDFDLEQDLVKAGELAGIRVPQTGERFVTTEYDLTDANAASGKYLTVVDGVLKTSATATKIQSVGYKTIGDHKLLGFKLV